jgi:hypothetical protein
MAQMPAPLRVSTSKPVPWRMPFEACTYIPNAGWPFARVGNQVVACARR